MFIKKNLNDMYVYIKSLLGGKLIKIKDLNFVKIYNIKKCYKNL